MEHAPAVIGKDCMVLPQSGHLGQSGIDKLRDSRPHSVTNYMYSPVQQQKKSQLLLRIHHMIRQEVEGKRSSLQMELLPVHRTPDHLQWEVHNQMREEEGRWPGRALHWEQEEGRWQRREGEGRVGVGTVLSKGLRWHRVGSWNNELCLMKGQWKWEEGSVCWLVDELMAGCLKEGERCSGSMYTRPDGNCAVRGGEEDGGVTSGMIGSHTSGNIRTNP